jgi:GH18 family chitinase
MTPWRPARVVQYFAQWAIYGRKFFPWEMHLENITHIHYAFFDVSSTCEVTSLDQWADFDILHRGVGDSHSTANGNVGAFQLLKQRYPHLSISLSLGG